MPGKGGVCFRGKREEGAAARMQRARRRNGRGGGRAVRGKCGEEGALRRGLSAFLHKGLAKNLHSRCGGERGRSGGGKKVCARHELSRAPRNLECGTMPGSEGGRNTGQEHARRRNGRGRRTRCARKIRGGGSAAAWAGGLFAKRPGEKPAKPLRRGMDIRARRLQTGTKQAARHSATRPEDAGGRFLHAKPKSHITGKRYCGILGFSPVGCWIYASLGRSDRSLLLKSTT